MLTKGWLSRQLKNAHETVQSLPAWMREEPKMCWKSTVTVTREEALSLIYIHLETISDENLADVLESVMGGDLHSHNYAIGEPDDRIQDG